MNDGKCAYGIPDAASFGTSAKATEHAPDFVSLDFNLSKQFKFTESQVPALRGRSSSICRTIRAFRPRRATFPPPALSAPSPGHSVGARTIQLALKSIFEPPRQAECLSLEFGHFSRWGSQPVGAPEKSQPRNLLIPSGRTGAFACHRQAECLSYRWRGGVFVRPAADQGFFRGTAGPGGAVPVSGSYRGWLRLVGFPSAPAGAAGFRSPPRQCR